MSRKRLTAWVLVLAVGMVARIGISAPRASIAELRAAVCCAKHCPDAPRPPMTPKRCCFVESGAHDPAGMTVAPSLHPPVVTALAPAPMPCGMPGRPDTTLRRDLAALRAGPPPFLETLKLRC